MLYEIATLQPPFKSSDMDGLFKKVLKGHYPSIPDSYSPDLASIIKKLIAVIPASRPSCDQLLKHPIVLKWAKHLGISASDEQTPRKDQNNNGQQQELGMESNQALLSTIVLPANLKLLGDRLPKA